MNLKLLAYFLATSLFVMMSNAFLLSGRCGLKSRIPYVQRLVTAQFSTVQVSAGMVKELREKSGAPMMDCKKALMSAEVNGDLTLAMDWLRKKGIAKASSSDRVTKEGVIAVNRNSKGYVTLLEVNSETGIGLSFLDSIAAGCRYVTYTNFIFRLRQHEQGFSVVCRFSFSDD
jgi:hypothetical protein